MSLYPRSHAWLKGVFPQSSLTVISAPLLIKRLTVFTFPTLQAVESGVSLYLLSVFTSAPLLMRNSIRLQSSQDAAQ
jgi:hypothetical protein